MQLINSIQLDNQIIDYTHDDLVLYCLTSSGSAIQLISFDAKTFNKIAEDSILARSNMFSNLVVDDNCLYFSSADGHIFVYDKYSIKLVKTIDTGMVVVSNLFVSDQHIAALFGLPLIFQYQTLTNKFVVAYFSKSNWQKEMQGSILDGTLRPIIILDKAYVTNDAFLYVFNQAELIYKGNLSLNSDYAPIITENYVVCTSKKGTMQLFNRNLAENSIRLFVQPNDSPPVKIDNDRIVWIAGSNVRKIDLRTKDITTITTIPDAVKHLSMTMNNAIYASNQNGDLLEIGLSGDMSKLKVSNLPLNKPVAIQDNIFVASESEMYKICLST